MRKQFTRIFTASVLLIHACFSVAAVNPITLTFHSGTTTFSTDNTGSANFLVALNSGIIPPNVPLTFMLTSPVNSPGLTATQKLSGSSPCSGVALCGYTFPLSAGETCCLAFNLTSSAAGNYTMQPTINTTPPAYPAQASVLPVTVTNQSPLSSISVSPTTLTLVQYGTSDCVTVTNQSSLSSVQNLTAPISPGNSMVTGGTSGTTCASTLAPNGSCDYCFLPGSQVENGTQATFAGSNTSNSVPVGITVSAAPTALLTISVSTLALSVNNPGLNAALTGHPRQITITNSDATATAYNVTFTAQNVAPANPTIASNATPNTSCGDIAPLGTCILTITPTGTTASATPYNTSPTPITLAISGDNTNTLTPTVNILTYGSVYEDGYVYSIDDSYANYPLGVSVGGKVAALTNQAAASPGGVIWGSNAAGTVNNTIIWGIAETSTTISPVPNAGQGATLYAGQQNCAGSTVGSCDTNNIYLFYQNYIGGAPVNLSFYAAGRCKQTIGNYTDWYLPSLCEMGPDSGNLVCNTVTVLQNMVNNLPSLLSDSIPCAAPAGCLAGLFWSSTEYSVLPSNFAWFQNFGATTAFQSANNKNLVYGVRCSRALTPN